MEKHDHIFIPGHRGLVGSAVVSYLQNQGFTNLILKPRDELDLRNQAQVEEFFNKTPVDIVILAAARVGGIIANQSRSGEFLYDNVMIAANVIHSAAQSSVRSLINFGSACIYPRECSQPMKEDQILKGLVEPTSEGYAMAKIAALKLCEHYKKQFGKNFFSVIPANLYGPHDNFHPTESHVIPAMLKRMHVAKLTKADEVIIWGSGNPTRDFLFVDDLVEFLPDLIRKYKGLLPLNLGSGLETSIGQLAQFSAEVVGFTGKLTFDHTKPDGSPRKILDSGKASELGWNPRTSLKRGLAKTYAWALENGALATSGAI